MLISANFKACRVWSISLRARHCEECFLRRSNPANRFALKLQKDWIATPRKERRARNDKYFTNTHHSLYTPARNATGVGKIGACISTQFHRYPRNGNHVKSLFHATVINSWEGKD